MTFAKYSRITPKRHTYIHPTPNRSPSPKIIKACPAVTTSLCFLLPSFLSPFLYLQKPSPSTHMHTHIHRKRQQSYRPLPLSISSSNQSNPWLAKENLAKAAPFGMYIQVPRPLHLLHTYTHTYTHTQPPSSVSEQHRHLHHPCCHPTLSPQGRSEASLWEHLY